MKRAVIIGLGLAIAMAGPALAQQTEAATVHHHVHHHVHVHHPYQAAQATIAPTAGTQTAPAAGSVVPGDAPEWDCKRDGCGFEPPGWHGEND